MQRVIVEIKVKVNGSWRFAGDMDVEAPPLGRVAVENTMRSRINTMGGTEARAYRLDDGTLFALEYN